jgi:uroporphyrinogen-III synthase
MQEQSLDGRVVAVPESRELDVFAGLLERRGATVLRCPLIAIKDAPDPAPVLQWVEQFNKGRCDELILLTGEGLRRIVACIDRHQPQLRTAFVQRLAEVRKITRGPKPARALRELGLKPDIAADVPTTQGVIESLQSVELHGHCVGVQLYGTEPNLPLIEFLETAGAAPLIVAPYVYTDAADDAQVRVVIERMGQGEVDIIAFTSMAQVERLFTVGSPAALQAAFARVQVAAVGPVVRDALLRHGVTVNCMPEDAFFMKPLTTALADTLGPAQP